MGDRKDLFPAIRATLRKLGFSQRKIDDEIMRIKDWNKGDLAYYLTKLEAEMGK